MNNTMMTLEIQLRRLCDGRWRVATSVGGHNWSMVGVTFPTLTDAREVASAIANGADVDRTEITEIGSES